MWKPILFLTAVLVGLGMTGFIWALNIADMWRMTSPKNHLIVQILIFFFALAVLIFVLWREISRIGLGVSKTDLYPPKRKRFIFRYGLDWLSRFKN